MSRRLTAVLVSVLAAGGCAPPDGHARMVELLAARAAADRGNPFYGTARLEALRAELAAAGAGAGWRLRLDTAAAELERPGGERAAIALLAGARDLLMQGRLDGGVTAAIAVDFHLGTAWLRLAETENCCARKSPDACIVPIRGGGLHTATEGARRAAEHFLAVAHNTAPGDYWHHAAVWLLNIAQMTLGAWPDGVPATHRLPARAFADDAVFPRFPDVAAAVGLDMFGTAGGVVVDDFDGDEQFDLVVSDWAPDGQLRCFRRGPDGVYVDRTDAAGLRGITGGLQLVHADHDDDGDLDVLVLRGAWWFESGRLPVSLLQNDGRGTFRDVTFEAGLGDHQLPTQAAAFADYDRDGDLDLFVGREHSDRVAAPSQLYRNEGGGRFRDVAVAAGVTNLAYCKGAAWGDVDGDGWPDLFVSNLAGDNRLYRNRGDGTFVDVAATAGVTGPRNAFACWFWDYDQDGALDLFVGCYETGVGHIASHLTGGGLRHDTMRLYRGDGRGGFRDVAAEVGLTYPAMPMGCSHGDLDNDGWPDFYLGTGDPQFANLMPNLMYRNVAGRSFASVTMAGGFGHLQKGHGVAFADFDGDGDQDVYAVQGGAYPADAFRNVLFANPGSGNRWLALRLVGTDSTRCALGAAIRVTVREGAVQRVVHARIGPGSSFGGNPLRPTIGLGAATAIERLEVCWPRSARWQTVDGAALDGTFRIVEGEARATEVAVPVVPLPR